MTTQNDSTFKEGQSTIRLPYFNGNDYPYWNTRMRIYLQALDYEIWKIVNDGPFMPTTKNKEREEIPKPSSCGSAYEIWKRLEVVYEGINQVKECKISIFTRQYEMFQMESYESVHDIYTRFIDIVNSLEALGKVFTNSEKVKKIIKSLPKVWRPKRMTIERISI